MNGLLLFCERIACTSWMEYPAWVRASGRGRAWCLALLYANDHTPHYEKGGGHYDRCRVDVFLLKS